MTTATRPRCVITWRGMCPLDVVFGLHVCGRAVDDHDDGLHVCDCGATHRVQPTRRQGT